MLQPITNSRPPPGQSSDNCQPASGNWQLTSGNPLTPHPSLLTPRSSPLFPLSSAFCPLHLSRTLYKFALLCKTNPICQQPNSRNRSSTNNLRKSVPLRQPKKQTQNKPNFLIAKMDASHLPTKAYENKPPLRPPAKQTQFIAAKPPCRAEMLHEAAMAKPDQTQFQTQKNPAAAAGAGVGIWRRINWWTDIRVAV